MVNSMYYNKYLFVIYTIPILINAQNYINYVESDNDFANPERGFYRYSATYSSNYNPLDSTILTNYRSLHNPPSNPEANYSIYSTLVFRYFYLEDFKESYISDEYLYQMQLDFDAARAAGVKLIPRFAYTNFVNNYSCDNWICPPYGDAPIEWVYNHINQISAIIQSNIDVIATFQMGFIGIWGEGYYTDFFGDASQYPYYLTNDDWNNRIQLLQMLLQIVPEQRMIQVRYPQKKQKMFNGINAPTDAPNITIQEAFTGSDISRIGFHNDCLLASSSDYGTYFNYGCDTSPISSEDTTNLKPYFSNEGKYTVIGGETCNGEYSPQNDCSSTDVSAFAELELERMHYSYLNSQYNNSVNNDWTDGGCMDEIKKRLGYRFVLKNSSINYTNTNINIEINLQNQGYASPYNPRYVELILRDTTTNQIWMSRFDSDPRFWFADSIIYNLSDTICFPYDMPNGTYEVLLNLPDPMQNLYSRPEYSIRLANFLPNYQEVWEPQTGYNKLGHFISIENNNNFIQCDNNVFIPLNYSICGDINNDQNITIQDVKLILEYIVGLTELNTIQISQSDFNNDGNINSQDATILLKYLLGIIEELPEC